MKLPNFKRLSFSDYPKEYKSLIDQLSYTINNGFESLFNALQNNISIRDNLFASVKDFSVSVTAAGVPSAATAIVISNQNPIDGLIVIKATNQTNSTVYPTGGIWVSYNQTGSKVSITNVSGLPANNNFTLRVIAFLT